ncbi:30S ribosomal protein S2, partial [Microcoleus anatoxicus PTRS2]
ANDDAIRSIKLIVGKLADAIYEGRHGQLEGNDIDEDYDYEGAYDGYEGEIEELDDPNYVDPDDETDDGEADES